MTFKKRILKYLVKILRAYMISKSVLIPDVEKQSWIPVRCGIQYWDPLCITSFVMVYLEYRQRRKLD